MFMNVTSPCKSLLNITFIVNALNSEKQPTNIPILFECICVYLINHQKDQLDKCNQSGIETSPSLEPLSKAICKCLRKSCYGASATDWCPMILPFIAHMNPYAENILTALVRDMLNGFYEVSEYIRI